jgi:hypothetical protein
MVVWLDAKQTQHAGTAFDVNSSLIYIKATGRTTDALLSATRRIRRLVRGHDSVLLLETACALLLPTTPLSGAQAVAKRISPLLSAIPYELQVYHGATALLVLQHVRAAGARPVTPEECDTLLSPLAPIAEQAEQAECQEMSATPLPYLAFLTDYPSPRLLHLFPYELACRYQCVPVGTERKMLTLATCHWLNREVVAHLRTATRREIFQVRCEITIIDEVLRYWQRTQELKGRARSESTTDELYSHSR